MSLDSPLYIHTGRDGALGDTSEADVRQLVSDLKNHRKIVFHLHGGLVAKKVALEKAQRLAPAYQAATARPVFIVWESGLLETLQNNLHEINKEKIFAILMKQVLKHAVGKLAQVDGARALGQLQLPRDIEVNVEFNRRLAGNGDGSVPYDGFTPRSHAEMTVAERNRVQATLAADADLNREIQSIVAGRAREPLDDGSKGGVATHRKSTSTLMSPDLVDSLAADTAGPKAKGLVSSAAMVIKAGRALSRVVERFREGRDHGLYTTVVEEVLREFYVANVGATIWGMMKQDTQDTFANSGQQPTRAGWFLVRQLGELLAAGYRPDISVVAHSAGAIYASHLLTHLTQARAAADHPLPADFSLKNLIFLAPACSFTLFDQALAGHRRAPLFDHFRMFSLKDEAEAGYWEVRAIYPRSLLYFVSGVVESEPDLPLLGMQRYFTHTSTYRQPEIARLRSWLEDAHLCRRVWAEDDLGAGLCSDAVTHGGFDSTELRGKTMQSIQHLLR